jgi:hypothetical protein
MSKILYIQKSHLEVLTNNSLVAILFSKYINTTHTLSPSISDIVETPTFFQNNLAMRNTPEVTGGRSDSGGRAINSLVAFYDIHARKGQVYTFIAKVKNL